MKEECLQNLWSQILKFAAQETFITILNIGEKPRSLEIELKKGQVEKSEYRDSIRLDPHQGQPTA
jgi:hypothetical protein